MSSGMRELIASAFGKGRGGNRICLYKDVLQCNPQATASELRKAYHKRALLYHPDKQQQQHAGTTTTTAEARIRTTTLKFQAISSAYELLRDPKKRALYDSTKRMNFDDGDDDDPSNATAPTATPSRGKRRSQDKDWVRFFQSVFEDVATAGNDFDRDSYCGSNEEKEDVIKYYQLCKGDMKKVLSCIVQGEATTDLRRWKKDILEPAIQHGKLERLGDLKSVPTSTNASHNSSTEPTTTRVLVGKRKIRKLVQSKKKKKVRSNPSKFNQGPSSILKATGLEDTDDEDDKPSEALATTDNINNSNKKMSKRDKMEFRVAKKRKERREKDIELSNIIQSKGWTTSTTAAPVNTSRRAATTTNNKHGLSSSFLSTLEKKFSEGSAQGNDSMVTNKGKGRIKRKRHA
eukprot:scaffold4916_cov111-Cylindrotheca_fusiformis.AAC.3